MTTKRTVQSSSSQEGYSSEELLLKMLKDLPPTVTTAVESVQPEQAAVWLEGHVNYRAVKPYKVAQYAKDILAGTWILNGEAIKFDANGNLIDGQTRLLACIKAGVPFTTLVIRGLPPEAVENLDSGVKRSFADVLRLRGYRDNARLAATISFSLQWEHGGGLLGAPPPFTQSEKLKWLERNEGIVEVTPLARKLRGNSKLPLSLAVAFVYRAMNLSEDWTTAFIGAVANPAKAVSEQEAPYALFRYLDKHKTKLDNVPAHIYLAVLIKAWNAYVQQIPVSTLRWRTSGPGAEREFPKMVKPEEDE